jgi:hypothetical protein
MEIQQQLEILKTTQDSKRNVTSTSNIGSSVTSKPTRTDSIASVIKVVQQ